MVADIAALRRIPLFATLSQEDLAQVVERQYVQARLVKVFKTSVGGREQVLRLAGAGYTCSGGGL